VLRVGLTGGIACGKSVVLRELAAAGLATLDLDEVAHAVIAPGGSAYARVRSTFGSRVVAADGTIDRAALGAIVFSDPEARARLNAIVHPEVRAAEATRLARLEEEGCAVSVSDGAVLVEAGAHLRFDRLVVVHCPGPTQLRRLVLRDGIAEEAARARIGAQMPLEEKRRYAHLEIDTGGRLEDTVEAARATAAALASLAARIPAPPTVDATRARGALAGGEGTGPRGLDARLLLAQVARSGAIDLVGLAPRLEPPWSGPWYRAGGSDDAPWPEALALVPVLWGLGRGADEEWQDASAASLARLTHRSDRAVAGACLAARLLRHVLQGGSLESARGRLPEFTQAAGRWGGGRPDPRVERALLAAGESPDAATARARAGEKGAEPAFAGALAGAALRPPGPGRPGDEALVVEVLGPAAA